MIELISVIVLLLLIRQLAKQWHKNKTNTASEIENRNTGHNENTIVGKSTFVLNSNKNKTLPTNATGKLDIEVSLDYNEDNELLEELEELGVPNQYSADITFDKMVEVLKEIENEQPDKPAQTGKLLYDNENTDWVEQLVATSENYQKRISGLIDIHLGSLEQNQAPVSENGIDGFDIGKYVG